jgi:hypothetical protein
VFICLSARDFARLSSCNHGPLELVLVHTFKRSSFHQLTLLHLLPGSFAIDTSFEQFFLLEPRVDLSMSLRTFTVFQDAVSSEAPQSKITRPNAMVTRSSSLNLTTSSNAIGSLNNLVALDKENFHPVTGERAGYSNNTGSKKRKTSVLSNKVQPPSTAKKDAQPEKKHKASTSTKGKVKRYGKPTVTARKGTSKRTISRKVSPMPRLNEEEEATKDRITQVNIDARCYELTVQPLADVSQAYGEGAAFEGIPTSSCEAKLKLSTANVRFHIIHT